MKKQNFLKGSIILMISAAAAKLFGALFKIPLTNILGGVGMSYFSCAYSIFMPVYALAATGLTAAVARMTAKSAASGNMAEVQRIRRTALLLFSVFGIAGSTLIIVLAKPLVFLFEGSYESAGAVAMIAPTIFFGCITAVERGYYEGLSNMYPTAFSQAAEGAVKVFAGLKLCGYVTEHPEAVMRYFPEMTDVRAAAAAAGIFGVTLSSAGAVVFFAAMRIFSRPSSGKGESSTIMSRRMTAYELIVNALPTGAGAVVTNLAAVIDMYTVIACLSGKNVSGVPVGINSVDIPNFVYGSFAGIALTVFNLVPSVTNMLGKGALTCVTSAYESGDKILLRNSTVQALTVSAVMAVPCAFGLAILSPEVLETLYPRQTDEVMICVMPLKLLMPGMAFLCVSYPLFSMLQAIGKPACPLKIMLMGTGIKLIGNLLLIPKLGINGAALSTTVCYAAVLAVSLAVYVHETGIDIKASPFVKILYSGAMCGGAAYTASMFMHRFGAGNLSVILVSAAAGGSVYIVMLYILMGVYGKKRTPEGGLSL